jgi:hypothetical protein
MWREKLVLTENVLFHRPKLMLTSRNKQRVAAQNRIVNCGGKSNFIKTPSKSI